MMFNTCLDYFETYLLNSLKYKFAEVSSNAVFFFNFRVFFVLLDFNINQVMRENNIYKSSVQVLHPMENVCSFQPHCVPAPQHNLAASYLLWNNTHTHKHAHMHAYTQARTHTNIPT